MNLSAHTVQYSTVTVYSIPFTVEDGILFFFVVIQLVNDSAFTRVHAWMQLFARTKLSATLTRFRTSPFLGRSVSSSRTNDAASPRAMVMPARLANPPSTGRARPTVVLLQPVVGFLQCRAPSMLGASMSV